MIVIFTRDETRKFRRVSFADIGPQQEGSWALSTRLLNREPEITLLVEGDVIQVFDENGNELEYYEYTEEEEEDEEPPDGQESPSPGGVFTVLKVMWGLAAVGMIAGFLWIMRG